MARFLHRTTEVDTASLGWWGQGGEDLGNRSAVHVARWSSSWVKLMPRWISLSPPFPPKLCFTTSQHSGCNSGQSTPCSYAGDTQRGRLRAKTANTRIPHGTTEGVDSMRDVRALSLGQVLMKNLLEKERGSLGHCWWGEGRLEWGDCPETHRTLLPLCLCWTHPPQTTPSLEAALPTQGPRQCSNSATSMRLSWHRVGADGYPGHRKWWRPGPVTVLHRFPFKTSVCSFQK